MKEPTSQEINGGFIDRANGRTDRLNDKPERPNERTSDRPMNESLGHNVCHLKEHNLDILSCFVYIQNYLETERNLKK